jgi:hypothetical protein
MARNSQIFSVHSAWLRRCASIVAVLACWFLYAPLYADASPLDLTTNSPGDVTSFSYDVEYDHTTGVLTADSTIDGNAYSILDDNDFFYPATVAISATLNPANGDLLGGTISITGDDSVYGNDTYGSGVLIEGNLTAFGFPDPTDSTNVPLEFEFAVTGGLLTALGGPYYQATTGGSIVHMFSDTPYFTGAWPSSDFSNSGSNNMLNTSSDTFPMSFAQTPEPSTFVLLAIAILPLAWRLRRRGQ